MSEEPKIRGKIIMSFPEQGPNFVEYEGTLDPKDIRNSRLLTRVVFRRFVLDNRAKASILPEPEPVKAPKKSKKKSTKKTEKEFVETIDES